MEAYPDNDDSENLVSFEKMLWRKEKDIVDELNKYKKDIDADQSRTSDSLPTVQEIKKLFKGMNGIHKSSWLTVPRQNHHKSESSSETEPTPSEVAVPSDDSAADDDSIHSLEDSSDAGDPKNKTKGKSAKKSRWHVV